MIGARRKKVRWKCEVELREGIQVEVGARAEYFYKVGGWGRDGAKKILRYQRRLV